MRGVPRPRASRPPHEYRLVAHTLLRRQLGRLSRVLVATTGNRPRSSRELRHNNSNTDNKHRVCSQGVVHIRRRRTRDPLAGRHVSPRVRGTERPGAATATPERHSSAAPLCRPPGGGLPSRLEPRGRSRGREDALPRDASSRHIAALGDLEASDSKGRPGSVLHGS